MSDIDDAGPRPQTRPGRAKGPQIGSSRGHGDASDHRASGGEKNPFHFRSIRRRTTLRKAQNALAASGAQIVTSPSSAARPDQMFRTRPARPRSAHGTPFKIGRLLLRLLLGFVLLSLVWVALYRIVPPPVTATMLGDLFTGRGIDKKWMSLDRMDPDMPRAAIAAEDGNFCRHNGFDVAAIEQAMRANLEGRRLRGGSTISQQVAKNAFLWQGGGFFRKGLEAWFTVLVEAMWPKRRIVEVYLNIAETGIGTYGANAGALRYFRHDASRLSPIEASRIAAVLPLPKKRGAIAPTGFTRRYGGNIQRRIPKMQRAGFYACL